MIESPGHAISRLAGVVWRAQDELWVRNLSYAHELWLEADGAAAEPLRVRYGQDGDPGFARAVGAESAYLRAPECVLVIQQIRRALPELPQPVTVRVSPVPEDLRAVADALCAPLFDGGQLPATYSEIMRRAGLTMKQARDRVKRICQLYEDQVPALAARIAERREQELDAGARRLLPGGVWTFPADERARRRTLALPDYYEVAHFLYRRRLVVSPEEDAA